MINFDCAYISTYIYGNAGNCVNENCILCNNLAYFLSDCCGIVRNGANIK